MNHEHEGPPAPDSLEMPAPTAWPIVLAAGVTLLAAGPVTSFALSAVGALLVIIAAVGWAREVFTPGLGEQREPLAPPELRARPVRPAAVPVQVLREGMPGHRMRLPEKIHPYSAGAWGGLVGSVAMAVPALLYGVLSGHGLWYPINLLAGMALPRFANMTVEELGQFSLVGLICGTIIHGVSSVAVGLIYGVLLPMLPQEPAYLWGGKYAPLIWGGIIAPLLWTGAIYGFMGVLNPLLRQHVDWLWFAVSQFAYGVTVGIVVTRSEKVYAS